MMPSHDSTSTIAALEAHVHSLRICDIHLSARACQAFCVIEFQCACGNRWFWRQAHNDVVQTLLRSAA